MEENCPEQIKQWLWFPPEFVRARGLDLDSLDFSMDSLALARLRTDELNVALVVQAQMGEVARLFAASGESARLADAPADE